MRRIALRAAQLSSGADPHDHINPLDGLARRCRRQFRHVDLVARNIFEGTRIFMEEVMMIAGIGIEVGPPGLDHDLSHEPGIGKLVQGIIDRRKRDTDTGCTRFAVQVFRGDMPVFALEQKFCQSNPLPGRSKACSFQTRDHP